jgi:acyltransferase-like protein
VTLDRLFDRLSRRTASGRHIPEIDGLRFVAIGLVVAFHAELLLGVAIGRADLGAPFGQVIHHASAPAPTRSWTVLAVLQGRMGVELFFVISGFILALPFIAANLRGGRPVSLRAYYLRRLTRLEPPYLLALTGFLILALVTGAADRSVLGHYGAGLGYANGFAFRGTNPRRRACVVPGGGGPVLRAGAVPGGRLSDPAHRRPSGSDRRRRRPGRPGPRHGGRPGPGLLAQRGELAPVLPRGFPAG